jgi:FtsP/CotA-like multicopper oxidase with cupredoxin domain
MGDELVLVLSDLALEEDGSLKPGDVGGDLAGLFGREGSQLLVNGRVRPTLRARPGTRQRWRIVNAAKSRYFQLELPGHRFVQIGTDGGMFGAPVELERLLVVPGQRADVWVTPEGSAGDALELRWIPYDRGYGSSEFRDPETLMRIELEGSAVTSPPPPPTSAEIETIDPSGATRISVSLTSTQIAEGELELGIDGVPGWEAGPLRATVGETQLWSVTNTIDWSHPFHLHGFFFQEVDEAGAPVEPRAWRDTLDVARDETKHFLVRYDHRPGTWMFHCHVLDHSDMGMMGMIALEN